MISLFSKRKVLNRALLSCLFIFFIAQSSFSQKVSATALTAYPNPSTGVVFVKSDVPLSDLEIVLITETNGRVIHGYEVEVSGNSLKVDFRNHPAGEYFVHLLFEDSSEILRILKE